MKDYYLCAEIGGTNLRYGLVDQKFRVLEFRKISTADFSEAVDKGEYLERIFRPILDRYGRDPMICAAISLASLMDRERTVCYSSPNIRGLDGLPLKKILEERLDLPVCMERDVNAVLLYELWKHKLGQEGIVIGVFIGTGLGNAMCINGKVYRGSTGSACELGHIPLPGLGEMCGCGKKGCIELKACGKVLAKLAREKYECPVCEIFVKYKDKEDVREVIRMCALATAAEVTILDPAYVLLGGGVTELEDFPLDYFTEIVKENLRIPNPRETWKVILASGDPEAGIVGAAMNAKLYLPK